jgi:hypothetical protein
MFNALLYGFNYEFFNGDKCNPWDSRQGVRLESEVDLEPETWRMEGYHSTTALAEKRNCFI